MTAPEASSHRARLLRRGFSLQGITLAIAAALTRSVALDGFGLSSRGAGRIHGSFIVIRHARRDERGDS
jgi:hypothetical protein